MPREMLELCSWIPKLQNHDLNKLLLFKDEKDSNILIQKQKTAEDHYLHSHSSVTPVL